MSGAAMSQSELEAQDGLSPVMGNPTTTQPAAPAEPQYPRAISVAQPLPTPAPSQTDAEAADGLSAIDPNSAPEFVPPIVAHSLFKNDVVGQLDRMPSDQAFDTAVRVNLGDLKWPLTRFKGINPDVAAQVDKLAKANGIPFDLAEHGKDDLAVLEQARSIYNSIFATDDKGNFVYPNTVAWLNDSVNLAKSKDDLDALKSLEDAARSRDQAGEGVWAQTARSAAAGIERQIGALFRLPAIAHTLEVEGAKTPLPVDQPVLPTRVVGTPQTYEPPDWLSTMFGLTRAINAHADSIDAATLRGHSIAGDLEAGHYGSAAQLTASNLASFLPTIAAAVVNPELALAQGAGSSAGSQFEQDLEMGKTPGQAATDAALNGEINALGMQAGGSVAQLQRVSRAFADPLARESATSLWGRLAKQAAISATQGGVTQAGIQAGDDAADYSTGNPDAFKNEAEKLFTAAALGFLADGTIAAPLGALHGLSRLRQQEQGAQQWDKLTGAALQSKLRERDPDGYAQLVTQNLEKNGQSTTINVDGDKLAAFFQNRPPTDLTQFMKDMGLPAQAITDAAKTGGSVDLPVGAYQARYSGTDLDKAIMKDIRFAPGGLSENEREAQIAHVQSLTESIKAELAKTAAGESTQLPERVKTMRESLMTPKDEGGMGYTAEQADSQLSVLLAGLGRIAAHRGETVDQAVNRIGLSLKVGDALLDLDGKALVRNQEGNETNANAQRAENGSGSSAGAPDERLQAGDAERASGSERNAAGTQSPSAVAEEHQRSAQDHLERKLSAMSPDMRAILEPSFRHSHEQLSALTPEKLADIISIQRAPYPVKGKRAAKRIRGPIHLVTALSPEARNDSLHRGRGEFFKQHLNADEIDVDNLDTLEPSHPIVDPTGLANEYYEFSGPEKELVSQAVDRVTNKLDEAHEAPNSYPETMNFIAAGVHDALSDADIQRFDKIFGKDNWLIKPWHPNHSMAGSGVFFAEAVKKAFAGERIPYNKGENPESVPDATLDKRELREIARPDYYMVQAKHLVAGATPEMRAAGLTILHGEKRVHLVTDAKGGAHVVLGGTFRRETGPETYNTRMHAFDTPESLAAEQAAKKAIEEYRVQERQGSSFGPDVVRLENGEYGVVESNPIMVPGMTDRRTGLEVDPATSGLYDYPQYQDAHVSAIRGVLPQHVKFAREIMAKLAGLPEGTDLGRIAETVTGRTLHQGERGAITFQDGKTVIHLFKTADMSTLLHETGHLFLHEMQALVDQGIADEHVKADLQTLMEFAGVKPGESLTREGEEKIVKGFESYLREGKAPSVGLAAAFARFRTWLTSIYRSIAALGVQPTDPVRQVFDRMLASEDDIAHAEAYYSRTGELLDLIKATDQEKQPVRDKLAKVQQTALEKQTRAYLKSYLQAVGGKRTIHDEARKAVEALPVYRAIAEAKDGGIDEDELREIAGTAGLNEFDTRFPNLAKKEGRHSLEALAIKYDFDSPRTLADNLVAAVPKQEAVRDYAKRLVSVKEQQLRDEIVKRGATPADAAMHTEGSLAYLVAEANLLAKQLQRGKAVRVEPPAFREAARQAIGNLPVKKAVRYSDFARGEARLSKQTLELARKGQWHDSGEGEQRRDGALTSRLKQIAQHAMVQEAIKARDERAEIVRRYTPSRLESTLKGVENDYLDPVREILSRYGLSDTAPSASFDLNKLAEFDPVLFSMVPSWLLRGENIGDYRNMPWARFQELDAAVRSLVSYGRDQLKSWREGQEKTLSAVRADSIARMAQLRDFKPAQRGDFAYPILRTADHMKSQGMMMKFLSQIMDNFAYERERQAGPMMRFEHAMANAELAQRTQQAELLKMMQPHYQELTQAAHRIEKELSRDFYVSELPRPKELADVGRGRWTVEELIAFLLNTGNKDQYETLKKAYGYDDAQVNRVSAFFTADELRAIQGLRDAIETMFEPLDKTNFEVYNRHIEKVSADPLTLTAKDGSPVTLKGGYYPLAFDHAIEEQFDKFGREDLMREQLRAVLRSKPVDSMTKSRVTGHDLAPLLSLGVLTKHIEDTTRFIHYSAIVRDLQRVFSNAEWKRTFKDKFGVSMYEEVNDWLRYQAAPRKLPQSRFMDAVDRGAEWIRSRTTYYALTSPKTGVLQRTGLINSAYQLGGWKWLAEGYKFMGTKGLGTSVLGRNNTESAQVIRGMSAFMRERDTNRDREARDAVGQIKLEEKTYRIPGTSKTFTSQDVREFAFAWLTANDRSVTYPVWAGAYQKYMQTMGATEHTLEQRQADAVAYADHMVRTTQPTALDVDLSAIQKGSALLKLFTPFMTWGFTFGNRLSYQARAWREGAITNSQYINHVFQEILLEPLARHAIALAFGGAVATGAYSWLQWPLAIVDNAFSWMPVLSNTSGIVQNGASLDSLSAAGTPLKLADNIGSDLLHEKGLTKLAWDVGRMTEWLTRIPALHVVKAILDVTTPAGEKQPYK